MTCSECSAWPALRGVHRRAVPDPQDIDERYVAPLPERCPGCHGRHLERGEPVEQYQIEIPQESIIRQFAIETGTCRDCGQSVQGRHELQTSNATGAAGVQLGPRAHASMTWLHKRLGLSHGKIRQLFEELFGVQISRATSARSCHRTARRCKAAVEQVRRDVRGSPQVTPDETGWRVDGGKAWLHAFAASQATCYVIDPTRSGQPAEDLLGRDWDGRLVHDGWSVYERFGAADPARRDAFRACEGHSRRAGPLSLVVRRRRRSEWRARPSTSWRALSGASRPSSRTW